jgi:putative ABC transport system permease protein
MRVLSVTPEYFATLGTPLLMGRALNERDGPDAPAVVLFNRAAIARWFPDGDPVGERVLLGGNPREVVGVVGDVLQRAPGNPIEPEMYVPYDQRTGRTMRLVVRARGDVAPITARIREEVRALDPQLPVQSIEPLERVFADAVARPRFYTTLLSLFAAVALVLAVVGIFGVMSYLVAQRAHEISIRMALGADRARVVGLVVGSAMKVAAAGLAAGLAGALAVSGVLASQLYGVGTADPVTLIAVLIVLALSALLASLLPALRAARFDPGAALRDG